ncbi:MAG: type ISP restriction/modification enzyme [Alphaproteobacteria bacterium]
MAVTELLQAYARRIRALRRANADVPETALAPAFHQLLEGLIPLLPIAPRLIVVPEYRNPGVGRPDIALVRQGAFARAFVELKAPAKPADPTRWRAQDARQFERFKELSCWATCNFAELRLFFRDEEQDTALVVPEQWLRPDRDDARANRAIAAQDSAPFLRLIEILCVVAGNEPAPRDAEELATLMAHSARLVRGIVRDRLAELRVEGNDRHALLQVRQEFRDVLYAHPEAAGYNPRDFDALFSAAFAQTLAFGLLLVREATTESVGPNAWEHMPAEHPLMRTALRVLSLPEVVRDVGIGFDVMTDTVNCFTPDILAIRPDRRDPILYFYEDFLKTFDPEQRERFGVYYTPIEVVQYIVGALDRALRENLRTQGLRDPAVTILDPAAGTGTFLLGVAERVRDREAAGGAGMAALALQGLARRMFGFELLVGPYAVAHYRLHHALRRREEGSEELQLPRLGVYLTDTLARPDSAAPMGPLGFVSEGIAEENREANRIKSRQQILAIIGNPPYRRLEVGENRTLVGDWMDGLWDDLKEPVRDAGQGNQLNTFPELSVAFWRWAIWKLFEAENAPRRGVVAFISNRKFLTGWPYAGLRKMMRERFDRIEIFDLRGDVRRGERAGVEDDQGVFNIQVGTAITIAIADGSKGGNELADVYYSDAWAEGLFSRRAKLGRLSAHSSDGAMPNGVQVERGLLDDLRPKPFTNAAFLPITECFAFRSSGIETTRDHLSYGLNDADLTHKIRAFLQLSRAQAKEVYSETRKMEFDVAFGQPFDARRIASASYRPLDRRTLYNQRGFVDWPRPDLQEVWGIRNTALFAMPNGTGAGPACWCHASLPDRHGFKGSYGGYAFPLYDRRPQVSSPNIPPALLQGLSAAYGRNVSARAVFAAILCLLSASSYTRRFAEDLEDTFPHVVFPTQIDVFTNAVKLGRKIRAIETFARAPGEAYLRPEFVRPETEPRGPVVFMEPDGEALSLCADGSGRITGLPQAVWNFSVSGYRVLPRWLEARAGLPADLGFVREFRDICGRIAELIDLFAQADTVLDATLGDSLSREALHFAPRPEADDGQD